MPEPLVFIYIVRLDWFSTTNLTRILLKTCLLWKACRWALVQLLPLYLAPRHSKVAQLFVLVIDLELDLIPERGLVKIFHFLFSAFLLWSTTSKVYCLVRVSIEHPFLWHVRPWGSIHPPILALPSPRLFWSNAPSRLKLMLRIIALGSEILTIFETTCAKRILRLFKGIYRRPIVIDLLYALIIYQP